MKCLLEIYQESEVEGYTFQREETVYIECETWKDAAYLAELLGTRTPKEVGNRKNVKTRLTISAIEEDSDDI